MSAVVYAVAGDLYLSPESATSGGVKLEGLDPDVPLRIVAPQGFITMRHGFKRDAVREVATPVAPKPILFVPAEGGDPETAKLAFSAHTLDGESFDTSGVNALLGGRSPRAVSAVIRPRDPNEDYIYFPHLQLSMDAEMHWNRSLAAFSELRESSLLLLPGKAQLSDVSAIVRGSASVIDDAIERAGGEGMAYVSKIVTRAELVALGGVQAGNISVAAAIPAGAVPLTATFRNRGTAFTSSAGAIAAMTAAIVADGQTTNLLDGAVTTLMTAGIRGARPFNNAAAAAAVLPGPNGAWTPRIRFTCDQDFDTLLGGDDGIEVVIVYQRVTLPV